MYKNDTEDKTLEEKLHLQLSGFKTPGHDDPENIDICVGPGEQYVVKIETVEGATEFSFQFGYETSISG